MAPKRKMETGNTEPVAKRKPDNSEGYVHLLSELAPELGLRGIHADSASSPMVYRALLSVLLRAASTGEARDAYGALRAARGADSSECATHLGVSNADNARAALSDIAGAVARGTGPRADGAALALYSVAGVGAADADDFDEPPPDGLSESLAFGGACAPLRDARALGGALALRHCAGQAQDAAKLVSDVAPRAGALRSDALRVLQGLLAASVKEPGARKEAVTRVVWALGELEGAVYARTLADPLLKFQACELFLTQYCGARRVVGRKAESMRVGEFIGDFLEMRVERRKRRKKAPELVTALVEAWLEVAERRCFVVAGSARARAAVLDRMNTRALELVEKCGVEEKDGQPLCRVMLAVQTRVIMMSM